MRTLMFVHPTQNAPNNGDQWHVIRTISGFIAQVVALQPLLIVVADAANWRFYVHGITSSNATRRIPLLLIHADAEERAAALRDGVAAVLTPEEGQHQMSAWLDRLAVSEAPSVRAERDCQCLEALPARGIEGVLRFNSGEYYAQHDLFEAQWMADTRPIRELYRAILQVGVGYYQIERGNYRGALKTLQKSVQWLVMLPDVCQGVNVAQLRTDSFAVRAELERLGEAQIAAFDRRLLKPVLLID